MHNFMWLKSNVYVNHVDAETSINVTRKLAVGELGNDSIIIRDLLIS